MSQIVLAPGVPGKFSEPKWNAARQRFQIHCLVGEPYGEPSKLHASGNSKPKARANLKRRIAEWKPRSESLGIYSPNVTVEELCQAWLHRYERDPTKRPQNAKHYRREINPATKGRGHKDKVTISGSVLGKMKAFASTDRAHVFFWSERCIAAVVGVVGNATQAVLHTTVLPAVAAAVAVIPPLARCWLRCTELRCSRARTPSRTPPAAPRQR